MEKAFYKWAIARHKPTSDQGKYVMSLINHGIGYHLLNKTRLKGDDLIVAFKFPLMKPLPDHLQFANDSQVRRLEEIESSRKGGK